MSFYRGIEDPPPGTLLQYLGVYVTHWRSEWNNLPDGFGGTIQVVGFIEDEQANELVEACKLLISQYEAEPDFVMGGKLTNAPFLRIRAALLAIQGEG